MEERIRLLAICYHYPPVGSAGTARSVRLLPKLVPLGIDPTVLTVDTETWESERFVVDHSHSDNVAAIPTIRINDSGWRYAIQRRWPKYNKYLWFAAYPALLDHASAWSARIQRQATKIVGESRPNVVYVSAPPFSAIGAASALAKKADAPLVIDYRDPWTTASLAAHPSRMHFFWERRTELRHLLRADRIILNTLEAKKLLVELDEQFSRIAVVIPNRYSLSSREPHTARPTKKRAETATLLYTGTLYEDRTVESRLGQFRPESIDEGARSLRPLIAAMHKLERTNPQALARLRVVIAGFVPDGQRGAIRESGLTENFELLGRVSHDESIQRVRSADALYLNQVAWSDPSAAMPHVPGKVFEYLASGRPILAPLAAGATRRVLTGQPNVTICELDDVNGIAAYLEEFSMTLRHLPEAPTTPTTKPAPDSGPSDLANCIRSAIDDPRIKTAIRPE